MREAKSISVSWAEKLLLLLSRRPGTDDSPTSQKEWNLDNALSLLCRVFPDFLNGVVGKKILDFGCGTGLQSVALVRAGASFVLGLETNPLTLQRARHLAQELGLDREVEFAERLDECLKGRFDVVISQNSMEHFPEPAKALMQMKSALAPEGRIFITFGPPWLSPYGAHMHFFTKVPWVNLLFTEKAVMNVRAFFRDDQARKYEEVESGLNKMTVAKFERTVADAGLRIQYRKYDCVKKLNFLGRLPGLRELSINQISCVLTCN